MQLHLKPQMFAVFEEYGFNREHPLFFYALFLRKLLLFCSLYMLSLSRSVLKRQLTPVDGHPVDFFIFNINDAVDHLRVIPDRVKFKQPH